MSIEKKSGLFYEIMIRGECGNDPKRSLGDLAGAHYIEGEAFIDTDTGEMIKYSVGEAQEMPVEKVAEYLGARFTAFEAQARSLQAELGEAVKVKAAKDAQIAEMQCRIDELTAANDDLAARHSAVKAALA